MKYASDDGNIFDSEQECLKYERELNAAKENENRLVAEKQERYEEMVSKAVELRECITKFNKDFHTNYYTGVAYMDSGFSLNKMFNCFF